MAAPKKKIVNCSHCGRGTSINGKDGFVYRKPNDGLMHQISCSCGIMTRMCKTESELRVVWNSKPKKPYIPEKITVVHPGIRGAQPDDNNLTKDGAKKVSPF